MFSLCCRRQFVTAKVPTDRAFQGAVSLVSLAGIALLARSRARDQASAAAAAADAGSGKAADKPAATYVRQENRVNRCQDSKSRYED